MTATLEAPATSKPAAAGHPSFTVEYAQLRDAVNACKLGAPTGPPVPILGGILFTARPDRTVTAATFDYETSVQVSMPGSAPAGSRYDYEPGRIVVQYDDLQRYLRAIAKTASKASLATTPVWLSCGDESGTLAAAGYTFPVKTLNVDDYPTLPSVDGPAVATVPTADFAAGAARLVKVASRDETLPALNGINMRIYDGHVELAATDRFRLAVHPIAADTGVLPSTDPLPPARVLAAAVKLLPADTTAIRVANVTPGSRIIGLESGPVTITIRTIGSDFVAYQSLIPDQFGSVYTVDRKTLSATLAVIGEVASAGAAIRLALDSRGATLSARDIETDRRASSPHLPGSVDGNTDATVSVNPRYLAAAIDSVGGDTVTIGIPDQTRPHSVRPIMLAASAAELADPDAFRHLVMPSRD